MDLESLTPEQLEQLAKDASAAAKRKREAQRKELRAEIDRMVRAAGFHLTDIIPELASVEVKPVLQARYAHPENPALTWTGQGRRPKWLVEAVEAGADQESFKIR